MKKPFLLYLFLVLLFFPNEMMAQLEKVNHWETVIYASDTFRYFIGNTMGPDASWLSDTFDDDTWLNGQGGFGYSDDDDVTLVPEGTLSVYVRKTFEISDTSQIALAILSMDFDDGFVAWLNGVEIARQGLGTEGDFPAFDLAAVSHNAVGIPYPSFRIEKDVLAGCLKNGVNVLCVQVNNSGPASSDLSCIPYLSFGVSYEDQVFGTVPYWFVAPVLPVSHNLPLVVVNTNGNSIPGDYKVTVELKIIDHGSAGNWTTDSANVYNGMAGIEIRGSSSAGFPKKNYGFELRQADGSDSAVSLLGMPAESDWVLHGPYSDKVLLRNYLAYNLFSRMGHYAPRTRLVEMYIDDQYQGVYVLLEKIKRDKKRVNIAKLEPADMSGLALTGGYIVKIDRSADGSYTDGWTSAFNGTGSGNEPVFFAYHYPKWEDITAVQAAYIKSQVDSFELALKKSTFRDPLVGYRAFIDVPSFIDYFLMIELSKNVDGYRLSTFLHKDRDDRDPLIHMGPVWDYDLAYGNADYYESDITTGYTYYVVADGWGTPFWWSRFLGDSWFNGKLKCRWEELRSGLFSDESLMGMVDSAITLMGPAVDRNFYTWPVHGTYVWPNVFVGDTYAEDVNFMKGWITDRTAWLDTHLPGTCLPDENTELPEQKLTVKTYPNPATDYVMVSIFNPERESLHMNVYNLTGQLVHSIDLTGEILQETRLNLNAGIYVISVNGVSGFKSVKVVVQ